MKHRIAIGYFVVATVAIILSVFGQVRGFLAFTTEQNFIIGLVSLLFVALGIDRMGQQKEVIEKINTNTVALDNANRKISDMEKQLLNVLEVVSRNNLFEFITSIDKIRASVNEDLKTVKTSLMGTSFKSHKLDPEDDEKFHEIIANKIKEESRFSYHVAYNNLFDFKQRKEAYSKAGLTSGQFERLHYYKYVGQIYLNVLIIDRRIAYIGFPEDRDDAHMQVALRVKSSGKEGEDFVGKLAEWYRAFVILPNEQSEDAEKLFQ